MSTRISLTGILMRSLKHRRARSYTALVAMTISAAIATALLSLYGDLESKLHREFRSFGANVVITPATTGQTFAPDSLEKVEQIAGPQSTAVEFAYAVATTDRGTPVVVSGTNFESVHRLNSWWHVDAWPASSDDSAILLGQRAAEFIADEHAVQLTYASKPIMLHGAGRLRTGGDEDSRLYMSMPAFRAWTGVQPSVIELQVVGGAAQVESTILHLRQQMPGLKIEPVRQLVEGEDRIIDKTHALMYGAVILISLTVAISVLATLSASILERRRDFALMKALGGSQLQLIGLFLLEAFILAILGVAAGFVIGSAASFVISQLNFHTATLPRISVLPVVLLLNLIIAATAALLPVRVLRGLQPAALLKGE